MRPFAAAVVTPRSNISPAGPTQSRVPDEPAAKPPADTRTRRPGETFVSGVSFPGLVTAPRVVGVLTITANEEWLMWPEESLAPQSIGDFPNGNSDKVFGRQDTGTLPSIASTAVGFVYP